MGFFKGFGLGLGGCFGLVAGVLLLSFMTGTFLVANSPRQVEASTAPASPHIQHASIQAPAKVTPKWDKSDAIQQEREGIIRRMVDSGLIDHIDFDARSNQTPDLYVGFRFQSATFAEKVKLAQGIYEYYYDGTEDFGLLDFRDVRTGKRVGTYTYKRGLDWN